MKIVLDGAGDVCMLIGMHHKTNQNNINYEALARLFTIYTRTAEGLPVMDKIVALCEKRGQHGLRVCFNHHMSIIRYLAK